MKNFVPYLVASALGGGLYYLALCIGSGGVDVERLAKCTGCGAVAGVIMAALSAATRNKPVPFLQSSEALMIAVFAIPVFSQKLTFLWQAFIFGYIALLLWECHQQKLPRTMR